VRGQAATVGHGDHWLLITHFYRDDVDAAYVRRGDTPSEWAVLPPLRRFGRQFQPLQVALPGGPEDASLRVLGFERDVRLTAVAELRVRDGQTDRRVVLASDEPGKARLAGEGYGMHYVDGVQPARLQTVIQGGHPGDGPPALEHDLVLLVTGPRIAPTLVILRPDRSRWSGRVTIAQEVKLSLHERTVRVTLVRLYHRPVAVAAAGPDAQGPVDALAVEAAIDDWRTVTYVAFDPFEHLAPGRRVYLPGGRDVFVSFSRLRVPLRAEVRLLSADYQTWPASVVPKDYLCRLRVTRGQDRRRETLSLNHPVKVGPYQISQGTWGPDPSDPSFITFGVATRPGLWLIWTGCGLMVAGMLVAFYIRPGRRKGAQP